jgi:hypothetical protein
MGNGGCFGDGLINAFNDNKVSSDCFRNFYAIPTLEQINLSSIFDKEVLLVPWKVIFTHNLYPISLFDDTRNNSTKCIERLVSFGMIEFDNIKEERSIAFSLGDQLLKLAISAVVGVN